MELSYFTDLLGRVFGDVVGTFGSVWPFLLISVLAAAFVTVYVGTDRVSGMLRKRKLVATGGAVLLATLTPFCSCGTTAVMVGMLASAAPWAPLVAFMVASPLTSPSELLLSAGLFGWPFALLFFVGTIGLGLVAGGVAGVLDRRGWLYDQARIRPDEEDCATGACSVPQPVALSLGPGAVAITELPPLREKWKIDEFLAELWATGRKLTLFFLAFTAVGYLAIEAIPTAWLTDYLGDGSVLAVPLAAILGIPAYINTEASLPLVATLMDGGMGPGPAMAFLVTGAGTSVGAISGLFVIAKKRVVGLVVALLFGGALVLGWLAQIIL
ncbi:MAG: permease [Acidimicrobiia bacterium]